MDAVATRRFCIRLNSRFTMRRIHGSNGEIHICTVSFDTAVRYLFARISCFIASVSTNFWFDLIYASCHWIHWTTRIPYADICKHIYFHYTSLAWGIIECILIGLKMSPYSAKLTHMYILHMYVHSYWVHILINEWT